MRLTKMIMPVLCGAFLAGCSSDDVHSEYQEWRELNDAYVASIAAATDDAGRPVYTVIDPVWAPGNPSYVRWITDPALTQDNLQPLDNSTVIVNYTLHDLNGNQLDKGAGTSFKPCNTVTGFWSTLTSMHVGDSVQTVVPYTAGYGTLYSGNVRPYTTLIFSIRLKEISGYEIQP